MVLKIDYYRIFCNLFSLPRRGNDGAETDHYQIFCNLPLFHGEGIMVLKIDYYWIFCNLSPLPVGEG